jgi:hypothetical protein
VRSARGRSCSPGACANRGAAADNGPRLTILLYEACNRPIWPIEHRFGRAPWFTAVATNLGVGAHKRRNRSTVGKWLALRPEFSTHQARMPPTARPAPRGERPGVTGFAAGPVPDSYRRITPVRWLRPYLIERAGVLALVLRRDPRRGREGFEDHDGDRTQSDSA